MEGGGAGSGGGGGGVSLALDGDVSEWDAAPPFGGVTFSQVGQSRRGEEHGRVESYRY